MMAAAWPGTVPQRRHEVGVGAPPPPVARDTGKVDCRASIWAATQPGRLASQASHALAAGSPAACVARAPA
jgi:hypothetical protein